MTPRLAIALAALVVAAAPADAARWWWWRTPTIGARKPRTPAETLAARSARLAAMRARRHEVLAERDRAGRAADLERLRAALGSLAAAPLRAFFDAPGELTPTTRLDQLTASPELAPGHTERVRRRAVADRILAGLIEDGFRTIEDLALSPERWFDARWANYGLPLYQAARALLFAAAAPDRRFDHAALLATARGRALAAARVAPAARAQRDRRHLGELALPRDPVYQFNVSHAFSESDAHLHRNNVDVRVTGDEIHLQQDVYIGLDPRAFMTRDSYRMGLLTAAHAFLDRAFVLTDASGRARYLVRVDLRFLERPPDEPTARADATLGTHGGWGRANTASLFVHSDPRTRAHEATHRVLGAIDEYPDPARPGRALRRRSLMADLAGPPLPSHARFAAELIESLTGERLVVARARPEPPARLGARTDEDVAMQRRSAAVGKDD